MCFSVLPCWLILRLLQVKTPLLRVVLLSASAIQSYALFHKRSCCHTVPLPSVSSDSLIDVILLTAAPTAVTSGAVSADIPFHIMRFVCVHMRCCPCGKLTQICTDCFQRGFLGIPFLHAVLCVATATKQSSATRFVQSQGAP